MTKRVALYARVSTDKAQTTENRLRELQAVALRLGWTVVAVYTDEGISGAKGRDKRPGLDALVKDIARREFDLIATWSVCRLGRSLPDLVNFLGDVQAKGVDLYLHVQGLDTSTPSGRMLFQMLGVFVEFERAMIRDRVVAGLNCVRGTKRLGRPPMTDAKVEQIKQALMASRGIRQTARKTGASTTSVMRVAQSITVEQDCSEMVAV
jgi:DNA invertase Pin-like site-specific DNA recombinase